MKLPSFSVQVFLGMAVGLVLGVWARALGAESGLAEGLRIIGEIFAQLLRALVVALVFTASVAPIAALRDLGNAARLVASTLIWFAITALIAVSIGLVLATVIAPGAHAGVDAAAAVRPATTGSWLDFLRGLVPANILGLAASTKLADGGATTSLSFNIHQIIVVAIAVGAAAVRVGAAVCACVLGQAIAIAPSRTEAW